MQHEYGFDTCLELLVLEAHGGRMPHHRSDVMTFNMGMSGKHMKSLRNYLAQLAGIPGV